MFVSTNDLVTVKNSLQSLLILQNSTGALPYAGVPFGSLIHAFSFTYHLYSLIGLNDYYLYTGDIDYLSANWHKFKLGLNYSLGMIDPSGMANVTTPADWLRFGMGGPQYRSKCHTVLHGQPGAIARRRTQRHYSDLQVVQICRKHQVSR
jgi:hypothetical protein